MENSHMHPVYTSEMFHFICASALKFLMNIKAQLLNSIRIVLLTYSELKVIGPMMDSSGGVHHRMLCMCCTPWIVLCQLYTNFCNISQQKDSFTCTYGQLLQKKIIFHIDARIITMRFGAVCCSAWGCSDDNKAVRSGGDQKSIQKGVTFAAGRKTQKSALVAASVKLRVAMITFTFFVKITLINLACPNKRASTVRRFFISLRVSNDQKLWMRSVKSPSSQYNISPRRVLAEIRCAVIPLYSSIPSPVAITVHDLLDFEYKTAR
ncbi:hypothetical protein Tsp_00200 [Trichinella spiralis]|uniref:hypothetical protein n=1 Tax=Trichinella spiralis TaxID=6334 RepID=UPI0001EFC440|nr:hypothetical protein Tsp_00200 [Trichinella spiralis]